MKNDAGLLWKNFSLGKELKIAGAFIYNGLKIFDSMGSFSNEDELFEFFYNISVGIERLEKIVVILIEHNKELDQDEFEKSLITHSHQDLMRRISKKHNCNLDNMHNEFLGLLGRFYKTMRYDRFTLSSVEDDAKERELLVNFLEKHLNIDISYNDMFNTPNQDKFKKFIGKVVGRISEALFSLVELEASKQNIYTYELPYESKASIIFIGKKYVFFEQDIVWKELLVYLMNTEESSGILDIIKDIEPLDFERKLVNEYLQVFKSDLKKDDLIDYIEHLYEDIKNKKERFEILNLLGNPNVYFENDSEDDTIF